MKRITTTVCHNCGSYVYEPPAWFGVLLALRSGVSGDRTGTVGTVPQIAERLGVSRQRAHLLVKAAVLNNVVELPFGDAKIYRKNRRGSQLLQSWITAGWPSKDGKVSQKKARKL